MKVPMPLPLPLMVPAAYYYYHHHHQHLLHSSSYSSYNSCPAMPKCVAGTWIRPRVCNPMALSKAWACEASPVALQWRAKPARTGDRIKPPPAEAAMVTAAAHSCHGDQPQGLEACSLIWAGLDWTVVHCAVGMNDGAREVGRVSLTFCIASPSPCFTHLPFWGQTQSQKYSFSSMPPSSKSSSEKRQ